MNEYCDRIKRIIEKIEEARKKSSYKQNVKLVAVSKTFSSDIIRKVYKCGINDFGENYVQEMLKKYNELADCKINWHFIGHLQKNKVKFIYDKIKLLHSLDSLALAELLNKRLEKDELYLDVLIQINIGRETKKFGINEENIDMFIENLSKFKRLKLKGFMCIPPFSIYKDETRKYFIKMRKIFEKYKSDNITELSMGMSKDFDIAIEEGATIVRIGTLIFGERS